MKILRTNNSFTITDFVIDPKYNYSEYTRNDESTGRTYNVGDKKIPSVTTILSGTQSEDKRKALAAWRKRVGYQEATKITTQAATRGTEMHYIMEQYLNGVGYLNLSKEGSLPRMMAHTIVSNLDQLSRVYGTEVSLHYEDQWAGSSDAVGVYNGKPTIIDFKQSNKPKKAEYIDSWFLQTSAYSLAHNVVYNSNITACVILVCTVDNLFQEFKIQGPELITYQNLFLGRLKKFNEMNNLG